MSEVAEAPLMERDLDEMEAKKKNKSVAEFNRLFRKVEELASFTQHPCWEAFHNTVQERIVKHSEAVLVVDQSTKELIAHQQSVTILRGIPDFFRKPLDEFESFIERTMHNSPTHLQDLTMRGRWDDKRGVVEVYDSRR